MLLVKTKVDMLIHTYDAAIAGLGLKATPTQSILLEHRGAGEPPSCCTTTTREFGYSSLRDWNMLTQLLLQRQFREWEERFLGEIRDVLLPLAARAVASCSRASRHQEPLHSAVSALQAIHVAVGLRTYPAFLNTEHLTEE